MVWCKKSFAYQHVASMSCMSNAAYSFLLTKAKSHVILILDVQRELATANQGCFMLLSFLVQRHSLAYWTRANSSSSVLYRGDIGSAAMASSQLPYAQVVNFERAACCGWRRLLPPEMSIRLGRWLRSWFSSFASVTSLSTIT